MRFFVADAISSLWPATSTFAIEAAIRISVLILAILINVAGDTAIAMVCYRWYETTPNNIYSTIDVKRYIC